MQENAPTRSDVLKWNFRSGRAAVKAKEASLDQPESRGGCWRSHSYVAFLLLGRVSLFVFVF
jgi:hypothetical protein